MQYLSAPNQQYNVMKAAPKSQCGFSLLEVLVAVVILSIGLLGMAGIQLKGLSSNNSANLRTQATLLANDLAERMHANPGGASSPDGADPNTNYANIDFNAINCNIVPSPYCSNTPSGEAAEICTPTQMAIFDATLWMCGLSQYDGVINILPKGTGTSPEELGPRVTITCNDRNSDDTDDCTPGSSMQIDITWPSISDKDANDKVKIKTVSLVTVP